MYPALKTSLVMVSLFSLASLLPAATAHAHEANYPHLHIAQSDYGKKGHGHDMNRPDGHEMKRTDGTKKGSGAMKRSEEAIPADYKNPPDAGN